MAVPSQIAGFWAAWKRYGRVAWKELFQPAINLARNGFRIKNGLAKAMRGRLAVDGKAGYDVRQDPSLRYSTEGYFGFSIHLITLLEIFF